MKNRITNTPLAFYWCENRNISCTSGIRYFTLVFPVNERIRHEMQHHARTERRYRSLFFTIPHPCYSYWRITSQCVKPQFLARTRKPQSLVGKRQQCFQKTQRWTENRDQSEVEAQPGVFKLRRKHADLPLQTEVTVFVPNANHFVELMKVTVKNTGDKALNLAAFYALPVFGRHADNFRDHRQVTTMFQRVFFNT